MSELTAAMLLSLRVAALATIVATLVANPLAYSLARRRFFGKSIFETLLTVPLVLPPTVVGYLLIVLLGRRTVAGHLIESIFGSTILFTTAGAILAASIVALPLLYLPAKAAFA